jgi:hypothetical protein
LAKEENMQDIFVESPYQKESLRRPLCARILENMAAQDTCKEASPSIVMVTYI